MEPAYTPDQAKPAIYSPRVVRGFSALFSGLAGGILAFHSLRDAGQPAAARQALWASVGYTALSVLLLNLIPVKTGGLSIGLGLAWGYVLDSYYFKKYLPDEASFPRKSWVKPLLICLLISAFFVWALLRQGGVGE